MFKRVVLISVLLALACANEPYDLAEEAEKQMQELIIFIQRRIIGADDDIQDLYNDFRDYSRNERYDANLDMQQEQRLIVAQIEQFETLANSAGKDISSCTNNREDFIKQLATDYLDKMTICIDANIVEGQKATRDAKYYVDIIMNKVHNLENQLRSCRGDFLCISPLVTQMELYRVNLVQDIRLEVQAIDRLLATMKLTSKSCADNDLSAYIAQVSAVLQDIITCANAILG